LAALISLVFLVKSLSDQWQGQIVDIRTERVTVSESDSDGSTDQRTEDQEFAYIREPSGKTRKMRAMKGWQVGDRLEKRRGEGDIRIFSR